MKARLRKFLSTLSETFWLVPGAMTLGGILLAAAFVQIDAADLLPAWFVESDYLYNGGGTGARTLLGVVASSTIGVAGTVFSITIAALSFAAGQMGPRLLRNFIRDRGNQVTLGVFLGTFSYALMVLRAVRTQGEGEFVPHLSLSVGILLAFICVGTLIYFVGHMAGRINVDTVIDLVSEDVRDAIARLTVAERQPDPPPSDIWRDAALITDTRRGYLQQLDCAGLAAWASDRQAMVHLLVRPGDYLFPGAPVALVRPAVEGCDLALRNALALGSRRGSPADLEFCIRQLVEVAVRALSPGINDPHTAVSVLDRLGVALCDLVPQHLASGVTFVDGRLAVVMPPVDYDGLVDAMFNMIRQYGGTSPAVLIRMLDVLTAVASCERDPLRLRALGRHADLVVDDARRLVASPADVSAVEQRHRDFTVMRDHGPLARIYARRRAPDSL